MANGTKREQRIKLRVQGSPVKLDATIIESSPDAKRIKVHFDGPLDDLVLIAFADTGLFSNGLTREGKPTENWLECTKSQIWEVL